MAKLFMLLLLPALAVAHINIGLEGSRNNWHVVFSGSVVDVISDTEVNTFQVNDNNIKNAVDRHFGRRPDDAYLRSPTPWGDLYRKHNWGQVTRTMRPISGRVINVSAQPQVVMKQISENKYSDVATFKVDISQTVENTVSSSWSKGGEFTLGQDISYGIGTLKTGYTHQWGENHVTSQSVTLGSTSGISIDLPPGKSVETILQATRGSVQMEIEYEAFLSGSVAVNYGSPHKGHHFWALDINKVMNAGGLNNRIISKEIITVGFYSDSSVRSQHLN